MKKILFVLTLLLVVGLTACTKQKSSLKLTDFANAFENAGHEVDLEEKPAYGFVGAEDGFIIYINGDKVAVYEFKNNAKLKNSTFTFDAVNANFGLETDSKIAVDIFNKVK